MRLLHGSRQAHSITRSCSKAVCDHYGVDMDMPVKDIPDNLLEKVLYGTKGIKFTSAMRTILVSSVKDISSLKVLLEM